jgi:hypothetical protein
MKLSRRALVRSGPPLLLALGAGARAEDAPSHAMHRHGMSEADDGADDAIYIDGSPRACAT